MRNNIYVCRWFRPPLYPEGADSAVFLYQEEDYPRALAMSKNILNLPLSPRLSELDIIKVCNCIDEYFKLRSREKAGAASLVSISEQ